MIWAVVSKEWGLDPSQHAEWVSCQVPSLPIITSRARPRTGVLADKRKRAAVDIGGPLRGTWLTVLVISIAFAAAGVAAAEPWSAPVGTALSADDVPGAAVSSTDGVATSALPRSERTPVTIGSEPTDTRETTTSSDVTSDEVAIWERRENHGFYVSGQATDTAGTGNGCDVSDVARSDVGKPDTEKSDPSSSTAACKEPATASDDHTSDGNGKGASDNDSGEKGTPASDDGGNGRGKGASDDGDGDE